MEEGATEPGQIGPRPIGQGHPTHPIRVSVRPPFHLERELNPKPFVRDKAIYLRGRPHGR
jgi:hypothetical protein